MKQRIWNPAHLDAPLRWRKPYLVTLDVDLFDGMTDEQIAAVFGVMAACPSSIFRVWTAHPNRAHKWFEWIVPNEGDVLYEHADNALIMLGLNMGDRPILLQRYPVRQAWKWPLPNVWLGIVAHTQAELDERSPEILACPAALHWLRLVLTEQMNLERWLSKRNLKMNSIGTCPGCGYYGPGLGHSCPKRSGHIDVSGAIGKGASPCDVEWIHDIIRQGRAAGVPVYVRALGSNARALGFDRITRARNGDRPGEWPDDLQVREWPEGVEVDG